MSRDFTKKQKAEIRRLMGLAWERELTAALEELRGKFDAFKAGDLDPFDLSDTIHDFHDHTARDLYKRYAYGSNFFAVPSAISREVIKRSEVSPELLALLEPTIKHLEE